MRLTDIWMPNFRDKLELGRLDRVVFGENKMAFEESAFVGCIGRTNDHHFPLVNVTLVDDAGAETFHRVLVEFLQLLF